jgi:hypothetical protein
MYMVHTINQERHRSRVTVTPGSRPHPAADGGGAQAPTGLRRHDQSGNDWISLRGVPHTDGFITV